MYKVQVTPLIGLPRFDGWAHVATSTNNRVIWVLSVAGQHARNSGRDLLDIISQAGEITDGAALYTLIQELIEDAARKEAELSLSACWFNDHAKSVFCCYQSSIVLQRDHKSGVLLQGGKQLTIIEGKVSHEDTYVFMTAQATQFLGEVQQKLDQRFEVDTIVTSITPSLHLEETTALSAMAFVKVDVRPIAAVVQEDIAQVDNEHRETVTAPTPLVVSPPSPMQQPVGNVAFSSLKVEKAEVDELWLSKPELKEDRLTVISLFLGKVVKTVLQRTSELPRVLKSAIEIRKKKSVTSFQPELPLGDMATVLGDQLVASDEVVSKSVAAQSIYGQSVYVGAAARRLPWKAIIGIGVVVVLIVAAGGFFLFRRQQQVSAASVAIQPFSEQLEKAREVVNQDPITARSSIQQAISGLESLEVTFRSQSVALKAVQEELKEARTFYDEVSGKEEFSELPVFFNSRTDDLDLVITQADVLKTGFVFFDQQKKEGVVVAEDSTRSGFTVDSTAEIKDIASTELSNSIWLLSDVVSEFDTSKSDAKLAEKLAASDRLAGGRLLSVFGNALYVFNPDERAILKYTEDEDTFTGPVKWLRSAPGLDFEQVTSMLVDGDIWLTDKQGRIFRLRGGNSQDFTVKGLELPFDSSLVLFTTPESDKLYLLEPAHHRVVIMTKDGEFIRQVSSSSLAAASQIVVNQAETKLLAISGSTVYEVGLQ